MIPVMCTIASSGGAYGAETLVDSTARKLTERSNYLYEIHEQHRARLDKKRAQLAKAQQRRGASARGGPGGFLALRNIIKYAAQQTPSHAMPPCPPKQHPHLERH